MGSVLPNRALNRSDDGSLTATSSFSSSSTTFPTVNCKQTDKTSATNTNMPFMEGVKRSSFPNSNYLYTAFFAHSQRERVANLCSQNIKYLVQEYMTLDIFNDVSKRENSHRFSYSFYSLWLTISDAMEGREIWKEFTVRHMTGVVFITALSTGCGRAHVLLPPPLLEETWLHTKLNALLYTVYIHFKLVFNQVWGFFFFTLEVGLFFFYFFFLG